MRGALFAAAKKRRRRIILPETGNRAVLAAAARAHADGIAECVLPGAADAIKKTAESYNIVLPDSVIFLPPPPLAALAPPLAKLRGISESAAAEWLQKDGIAAAAMLVRLNYADGMLAGAAHTSAAVLRPVLQIIGKAAGASLASSFFLMDFSDGAKVFADCALNICPSAEELAEIAVQTAASARRFGIAPAVAMLGYTTGGSAGGEESARVFAAAAAAKQKMPGVPVFGPIQYDAAVSPRIGAKKAPEWEHAGRANVLIFPNLSAGNIAYKAVQQSAGIAAIGPLVQGIAAPANDLSRGATEDDIYCAIAATAAQAGEDIPQ
ncbi:MAG: hypothetical protein HAW59_00050 [Betaproteobacteria bacterium]|nr:hypothetical protein [Betaproteobacteria bacterium]